MALVSRRKNGHTTLSLVAVVYPCQLDEVGRCPRHRLPSMTPTRHNTDESQLIDRLRANEPAAYEQLVRTSYPKLMSVARRFMRNDADAQDAVQDAFVSAFKAMPSFQGDSLLSSWLHTIVCRACLMKLRAKRRRPDGVSIDALLPAYHDDGHRQHPGPEWNESPFDVVASEETRQVVRQCIDQLPEEYRSILLLRDIEGLSNEQAAQMLDMNVNSLKTRLHRARQALRTLLEPHVKGTVQGNVKGSSR
jgi:RNA polymerase sigma-70 factor, ECF subfamily